jgi:hypothetical protein
MIHANEILPSLFQAFTTNNSNVFILILAISEGRAGIAWVPSNKIPFLPPPRCKAPHSFPKMFFSSLPSFHYPSWLSPSLTGFKELNYWRIKLLLIKFNIGPLKTNHLGSSDENIAYTTLPEIWDPSVLSHISGRIRKSKRLKYVSEHRKHVCDGLITRPEESYRVSCMCDHRNPEMGPMFQDGNERKMDEKMKWMENMTLTQIISREFI